jgi:hypothetical protein
MGRHVTGQPRVAASPEWPFRRQEQR